MPRPTGRGFAVLGLALGTYMAARLVGTWELYLFAFAFLAAVVVSWLLVMVTGRRIRVERAVKPERPLAGDDLDFSFRIKNASLLPGPQLTLHSSLAGLSNEDVEQQVESLVPRGERRLKATAGGALRGVHTLSPIQALAEDPLGVARATHRVSESLTVTVYPRVAFLESCALYPDIGLRHDWSGQHSLRTFGSAEFRGIRPHQPGEPLSHIDWKSTAKTGTLMLREMDEPAGSEITLLLDGTAAQVLGNAPDTNFELAVRAAGSVADFALRAGRSVNLLCHQRKWSQARLTADGSGRRALLEALAQVRPDASGPLVNALRHLRADGVHLLRAQNVTLVSMSLDPQLARALVSLREDRVRLALLYVVGASFAGAAAGAAATLLPFLPHRDHDSLGSELPVEARGLLLSLASAGIPSLTLSHGEDLVRSLSLWETPRRRTGTP